MAILNRIIFTTLVYLSFGAYANDLETGDILLQPLDCHACRLIEQEENSDFAHIGIVLVEDKVRVVEAYGRVQKIDLEKFLSRSDKTRSIVVKRFKYSFDKKDLARVLNQYLGLPYDREFLWDNKIMDQEALYCSELIYKAMRQVTSFPSLQTKKMHFDRNPELWDKYFKNKTPRGKEGLSPEDFNLSSDYYFVKEL